MNSEIVIKVEKIGKKYQIGKNLIPAKSVIGKIKQLLISPFAWLISQIKKPADAETLWVLRDINFEVKKGDVVGIIGGNGAGKSTLLKILSRITDPAEGRAEIHGRVGTLLEVGTGMHPELTGRENIYMNGTVLGMTKKEIDGKFDEIVEFSGIKKFIDTPTKRYSSGMKVRLGFSIAAHLEPEILIVDEVLAVGDVDFQQKCLGKMRDVAGHGRTVLFVSHNMTAVKQLCNCGLILKEGKMLNYSRDVNGLIDQYLHEGKGSDIKSDFWQNEEASLTGNEYIIPLKMYFSDEHGEVKNGILHPDKDLYINIELDIIKAHNRLTMGYSVYNDQDQLVYYSTTNDNQNRVLKAGVFKLRSKIPHNVLNLGDYRIELYSVVQKIKWLYEPGKSNPSVKLNIYSFAYHTIVTDARRQTVIAPLYDWEVKGL